MSDSQQCHKKLYLIKKELNIHIYTFNYCFYTKVTFRYYCRKLIGIIRIKYSSSYKNDVIFTYKVVIYVCLYVCPIIPQEPWTDLPQILIWELGKTTGMFLAWF